LQRYDESLLRRVAAKLFKPRNEWPLEELIERNVATVSNIAVIDRRLESLDPAGRRVLALIGHSRQPRWKVGNLLEMLVALGGAVDVRPVLMLLEAGLLYPDLPDRIPHLKSFEQWLGLGSVNGLAVFAHPQVTGRALGEDLGLPDLSPCHPLTLSPSQPATPQEADGLDWPLRLAVVWQQVAAGPLRRTQQGEFFKRDLDRLRGDPLLNGAPAESIGEIPDAGLLAVELALVEGLVQEKDGEITAAALPAVWDRGLAATLESLWAAVPCLEAWNAREGWRGAGAAGNPYPSAYLLALLLLARLPEAGWACPDVVEQWVLGHHPYWQQSRIEDRGSRIEDRAARGANAGCSAILDPPSSIRGFLLGLAYPLRLLQAARDRDGSWLVRLSPTGRWLLGLAEEPPAPAAYTQTLLVQPNLEVVAYRQGLTPGLVSRLGQFAAWKSLGAACTLQLQPDTVYRALETGQTFETILQTLEQHGMRAMPPAVVESLRTWANKRERLGIYPSATLFEFTSADDLNDALARGLPGVRLSDRLAVVTNESAVDFRHFRLTATRDYGLPLEKCVDVEKDGVTLTVDMTRSDLLLETELPRFAEPVDPGGTNGRRQYRLTPASLAAGQGGGLGLRALEEWFVQRTGQPLSPAARLLLVGPLVPPLELRPQLVLHVSTPDVADGLVQWPGTRALIQARLGPTALVVAEEHVEELRKRLGELGISFQG
jgi:hypothetical protein